MNLGNCLRVAIVIAAAFTSKLAVAQVSEVPPRLEIEILDPGVDPLGNPAVLLRDSATAEDIQEIDIPPTILVHRYFYTGNRDFQAQLMPGGPCIAVMNHPRTGERCYVSVQMLPGAPRVYYTGRKIEYDFGDRGISILFGLGEPTVRYRNGNKLKTKVSTLLRTEQTMQTVRKMRQATASSSKKAITLVTGTGLMASDAVSALFAPIQQLTSLGPFAGLDQRLSQRVEQHKAEKALKASTTTERQWVKRFP